ncbi:hypothetical protein KKHFBJBL_01702 [Brevundimonas sp. NIBR11]|nr:hypothetical protein KKHFBJBL_01702 [Brevundimonas sp. NIBR11]
MKWFIVGGLIHCAVWPIITCQTPWGGLIGTALCTAFWFGQISARPSPTTEGGDHGR